MDWVWIFLGCARRGFIRRIEHLQYRLFKNNKVVIDISVSYFLMEAIKFLNYTALSHSSYYFNYSKLNSLFCPFIYILFF